MAEAIQDRPVPTERRARRVAHTVGARIARHWSHRRLRENRLLAYIGPGWITGASDDDPSGIATYSQAGAQFGYAMCWVMLFCLPLMAAIQEISARIGRVTGQGIAGNIRAHYARWLLRAIVGLLLVANTINLGADLGAMGAATAAADRRPDRSSMWSASPLAAPCLEVFSRYERYVSILKWTSFVLLAYVAVALVVHVPWRLVALSHLRAQFLAGRPTTSSPSSRCSARRSRPTASSGNPREEAEDERIDPAAHPLLEAPEQAPARDRSHALRHLYRDGLLERDQPVHHRQHRGDA